MTINIAVLTSEALVLSCDSIASLQSGMSKFAIGVPTVGGRTHVGVVTRHEGFRMLGEPELRHTHIGFVS